MITSYYIDQLGREISKSTILSHLHTLNLKGGKRRESNELLKKKDFSIIFKEKEQNHEER